MDMSPKLREVHVPRSTRLVLSGQYTENRERYMAQSKLTKNGVVAEVPSISHARIVNKGLDIHSTTRTELGMEHDAQMGLKRA